MSKTEQEQEGDDVSADARTLITLSNGKSIPVIKPRSFSTKLKPRYVVAAAKKYLSIFELSRLLDKNKKVVGIRRVSNPSSIEEKLLELTHLVVVVEKEKNLFAECLAPVDEAGLYMQYESNVRKQVSSNTFYRGVADHNGFSLLSFSYIIENTDTNVTFSIAYIDFYSLQVSKFKGCVNLRTATKFKFNILLHCGSLCIFWPFHKRFTMLDFSSKSLEFQTFPIEEELEDFYIAELNGRYLTIITKNSDFEDDVFFDKCMSKRHTVYYNTMTGKRHTSKDALKKMSTLMPIEKPVDVIFIDMPNKPMWMVTECNPEEMALTSISFFSDVEDVNEPHTPITPRAITHVMKRIELDQLFHSHRDLFTAPNQRQMNFEVCRIHWHIFVWISKQNILEVDLHDLEPTSVLQMAIRHYDDYKNELNEFTVKMSLSRKDVNVFVRDRKSVIHFEAFDLPHPLSLKELAKYAVVTKHPRSTIDDFLEDSVLKTELLAAY